MKKGKVVVAFFMSRIQRTLLDAVLVLTTEFTTMFTDILHVLQERTYPIQITEGFCSTCTSGYESVFVR